MNRPFQTGAGTPTLLAQMAAVATACITGTWIFAVYFQSNELAGYKASQELNLPARIQQLGDAANALQLSASERQSLAAFQALPMQLNALQGQLAAGKTEIENLQRVLSDRTAERDVLTSKIAKLVGSGKHLKVEFAHSAYLIPNELFLGVRGYLAYGACSVVVGNQAHSMTVGERVGGTDGGYDWHLDMTQIDDDGCDFSFTAQEHKVEKPPA
ncbi:hypothetical protein [Luteibacter aegosomatissinici]|uniref:hypothetical protein n=1 Tax=Luteibacter aegosomatissinici TaxID=2911539 RepID=UPI001FFADCC8|nr:hypothetical protein [Luteibacter aegosomatissinici]UPG92831.1 hypothetical protein L2Y97_13245 [Luteibacter aegosomatissinici]